MWGTVTFDASGSSFAVALKVTNDQGETDTATATVGAQPKSLFDDPLPGFNNPPMNTQEIDSTLYEDVNADGDGLNPAQTVTLWTQFVINEDDFGDLTQQQVDVLDRDADGNLSPSDAVELWTQQVLAG
jgi:hypothetical protein